MHGYVDLLCLFREDFRLADLIPVAVDDNYVDEIGLSWLGAKSGGTAAGLLAEGDRGRVIETLNSLQSEGRADNILVLLDIDMPRQTGFDTLQMIREHECLQELPVIMMSASHDEGQEAAAAPGANAFSVKPFTLDSFFWALSETPELKRRLMN